MTEGKLDQYRLWRELDYLRARWQAVQVPPEPHMPEAERAAFEGLLNHTGFYMEYGTGGSTVLASQLNVPRIVGVESDERFANALRENFATAASDISIIHASFGRVRAWGRPVDVEPTPQNREKWFRYVTAPWDVAGNALPDLLLIDGRFRVASALYSLLKLPEHASTKIFFDDYACRPEYWAVTQFMGNPVSVGRAAIFERPRNFDQQKCADLLTKYALDWR